MAEITNQTAESLVNQLIQMNNFLGSIATELSAIRKLASEMKRSEAKPVEPVRQP